MSMELELELWVWHLYLRLSLSCNPSFLHVQLLQATARRGVHNTSIPVPPLETTRVCRAKKSSGFGHADLVHAEREHGNMAHRSTWDIVSMCTNAWINIIEAILCLKGAIK